MANTLISFLGTNAYIRCSYYFENDPSNAVRDVRFIQEAIVRKYCQDWSQDDRILICMTEKAEKYNWEQVNTNKLDGTTEQSFPPHTLEEGLRLSGTKASIEAVRSMDEGFTEDGTWSIFSRIVELVRQGDTLWLDITHGFRSLPMLALVLANYLKVVRQIHVRAIFYGAFESLGTNQEVIALGLAARTVPVLNLVAFDTLLDWTAGADAFITFGVSKRIENTINAEIRDVLSETSGQDPRGKSLRNFSRSLHNIPPLFETVRGKEIAEGKAFKSVIDSIEELKNQPHDYRALEPLLEKIRQKAKPFARNDSRNFFTAVEWCLEHGMIQQGITFLQEGIISMILDECGFESNDEDYRDLCSQAFKIVSQKIPEDDWLDSSKENREKSLLLQNTITKHPGIAGSYGCISDYRNDINHGGCTVTSGSQPRPAKKFEEVLARHFGIIRDSFPANASGS